MRIIAGDFARRRIIAPKGADTRPTTDRVRESLFQHLETSRLENGFSELHVVDLFAGSGALGLEALSRGAAHVTFVESARSAVTAIRDNVAALGCDARCQVVHARLPDAVRRIRRPAGLWFADPPYARAGAWDVLESAAAAGLVRPDALFVYEYGRDTPTTAPPPSWTHEGDRSWGDTRVSFWRYQRG